MSVCFYGSTYGLDCRVCQCMSADCSFGYLYGKVQLNNAFLSTQRDIFRLQGKILHIRKIHLHKHTHWLTAVTAMNWTLSGVYYSCSSLMNSSAWVHVYGCTVHYGVAINVSMKRRVLPFSMSVRLFNVTFHRHTIHNLYLSEEGLQVLEHLGEDGLLENMQSLN